MWPHRLCCTCYSFTTGSYSRSYSKATQSTIMQKQRVTGRFVAELMHWQTFGAGGHLPRGCSQLGYVHHEPMHKYIYSFQILRRMLEGHGGSQAAHLFASLFAAHLFCVLRWTPFVVYSIVERSSALGRMSGLYYLTRD